jgi:hypothetical protein
MKAREAATAIILAVIALYWVFDDVTEKPKCYYQETLEDGRIKGEWKECD